MKRLLYVATLLMAASLIFAPAAIAQNPIQEQGCPPGQTSNAAGTTCVDLATGEVVTDLGTNPNSNPCPEGVAQLPDGTCNIGQPQPQQPKMEEKMEQPKMEEKGKEKEKMKEEGKKKEEKKEMPKTGGAAVGSLLGLGAGALLVGGGLIAIKRRN